MMKKEYTALEVWQRASGYCARGEHCAAEVREKLWQWGVPESEHNAIIERLEDEDFINDFRYSRAYVHDKVAYQGWGRVKLQMMLRQKRLSDSSISKALQQINTDDYQSSLRRALQHYPADRERAIRFALQRGFEYQEIVAALAD